jgi:hypothetical protein
MAGDLEREVIAARERRLRETARGWRTARLDARGGELDVGGCARDHAVRDGVRRAAGKEKKQRREAKTKQYWLHAREEKQLAGQRRSSPGKPPEPVCTLLRA